MENEASKDEIIPEELIVNQELFSFFDKEDQGTIPLSSVAMYMRGLGHCPTENQLKEILEELGHPKEQVVSFERITALLNARNKEQCIEEELVEVFQGIQSYHGASSDGARSELIQILAMKKTLCDAGEALTEAEFDEFVDFLSSAGLKTNQQDFNFKNLSKIIAYGYQEM